jgi:hypothetical protein
MSVTVENIDIGNVANDGTGDPLRVAFQKIQNNFTALSTLSFPSPGGANGAIQYNLNGLNFAGTSNLVYDSANNNVDLGANIVINNGAVINFGSSSSPIHQVFVSNAGLAIGNVTMTETGNTINFSLLGSPGSKISLAGLNDINVTGNIITSGNVALGNSLAYGNTIIGSFEVITPDNTANQILWQQPYANLTSGSFKITSTTLQGSQYTQYGVVDVTRTSDGSEVIFNAHSTLFTGAPVTVYNVDYIFGNIAIMVSPRFNENVSHLVSYEIDN